MRKKFGDEEDSRIDEGIEEIRKEVDKRDIVGCRKKKILVLKEIKRRNLKDLKVLRNVDNKDRIEMRINWNDRMKKM